MEGIVPVINWARRKLDLTHAVFLLLLLPLSWWLLLLVIAVVVVDLGRRITIFLRFIGRAVKTHHLFS